MVRVAPRRVDDALRNPSTAIHQPILRLEVLRENEDCFFAELKACRQPVEVRLFQRQALRLANALMHRLESHDGSLALTRERAI